MKNSSLFDPNLITPRLGFVDYALLVVMMAVSSGIGFYYACTGGKQKTTKEFLLGNRSMTFLPVGFSLLATFLSATTLLGMTSEIYTFGSQYSFLLVGNILLFPIVCYCFLPVYYELEIISVNEYLDRRFNNFIRKICAAIYILQTVFFLAVVVYAPALALSHASGINFWISVTIIIGICTLYTTIGGIKAVMWTDVLQCLVIIVAVCVIIIKGALKVGGFQHVWVTSILGKRVEFLNPSTDLRVRHTIWTQSIGSLFVILYSYAVNQAQVQRYLSARSLKIAKRAIWGNFFGWCWVIGSCTMIGFILYTRYKDCDPASIGMIQRNDQLLPLFAVEVLGGVPGFSGLFIAGLLSGSLSSLSTGLNALAAVTLEDFVKTSRYFKISESRATLLAKFLAVAYGILCVACIGLVASFSTVSEAALGSLGLFGGPLLGVFILGMFFPWTNSWGAFAGITLGLSQSLWIFIGTRIFRIKPPRLPVSVDGCPANFSIYNEIAITSTTMSLIDSNYTTSSYNELSSPSYLQTNNDEPHLMYLYSISYMWYSLVTCSVAVVSGLIVSFLTGPKRASDFDPKLFSPVTRKIMQKIPKSWRLPLGCDIREEKEMDTITYEADNLLSSKC